jgi:hypothetical protein
MFTVARRGLKENGQNTRWCLRRWPNSWHSVVMDSRSIYGLSPYNNKDGLRVNRASNSSGEVHFSFRSVARRSLRPWNSALYISRRGLNFILRFPQSDRYRIQCFPRRMVASSSFKVWLRNPEPSETAGGSPDQMVISRPSLHHTDDVFVKVI